MGRSIARHSAGVRPRPPRRRSSRLRAWSPVSHSSAIQAARVPGWHFDTPKSNTWTMFGCVMRATVFASPANPARNSAAPPRVKRWGVLSTFSATGRSSAPAPQVDDAEASLGNGAVDAKRPSSVVPASWKTSLDAVRRHVQSRRTEASIEVNVRAAGRSLPAAPPLTHGIKANPSAASSSRKGGRAAKERAERRSSAHH